MSEFIRCIQDKRIKYPTSFCGKKGGGFLFMLTGLEHAVAVLAIGTRLQPCPECMALALKTVYAGEVELEQVFYGNELPEWIANRWGRGFLRGSAKKIAAHMLGIKALLQITDNNVPLDLPDVEACSQFLDEAEKQGMIWRPRMPEMETYGQWGKIAPHWATLEEDLAHDKATIAQWEADRWIGKRGQKLKVPRDMAYPPLRVVWRLSTLGVRNDPYADRSIHPFQVE